MAIRIVRNEAGNCINFQGSSNPTYFNACLSGQVDAADNTKVHVINDVITGLTGVTSYEFYALPYTELEDKDGNAFADAQEAADYITANANVIGLGGSGIDLSGQDVCFNLDATSTSILLSTGHAFGVNTIKAVADGGDISIISIDASDSITHFTGLEVGKACVGSAVIGGGLNDVINTLNELFTVGAFQSVVISDPYSTMIADVSGVLAGYTLEGSTVVDPIGNDIAGNSASGNYAGLKSTATIDQAGEYFTFDIRGEGQIGFGLVHSDASFAAGHYSGSASYADPATFAVSNSAHYGYQFSHWFHPTPNGSWTNYGANTSYSMKAGWSSWDGQADWLAGNPVKMRVGLDTNGYISIESLMDDGSWRVHTRTSYAAVEGAEFHLGIKMANSAPRVYSAPMVHLLEPAAPTMYFRHIESPDGNWHYPLFATEEEANYYDLQNGGTGTSSTNVYPDEPTFSTWYEPTNGHTHNGTQSPEDFVTLFMGNPINWTEITSQTNADLAPTAYSDYTLTVNELATLHHQTQPADSGYTTSFSNLPAGIVDIGGGELSGSAPEVTGDYVANPSDTYTITVTRTNSYGSASGTLTLVVTNLTAPVNPISGFNHVSGTTAMIDSDTMDSGSVVHVNTTVADGERFVIEKAYIEANILPNLVAANDMYIIGLANQPETFGTLDLTDFDAAIVWEYESASSHTFKFYRDGSVVQNIVINSLTQAFYDYAIEINGTSAWLIACNVNSIMNEPSPADGGTFSHTYEATSIEDTAPVTICMAALNTTGDISTTDIETIDTPAAPATNTTSWTKALDFSGSEYAIHVNNSMFYQPLQMAGLANLVAGHSTQGYTSGDASSRPWETVVVFKSDGYSGNQMVWNQGEGSSSGSDNIFVNVTAAGNVHFGWGREGVGYNQCRIATGINTSTWYAVYVAHSGERLGGGAATASALADCFDIRLMSSADSFASLSSNLSVAANWTSTGARMDRTVAGDFTVGGRGTGYSFRGKVASMIVHCLEANKAMPDATEIELMITDPLKWEADYLIGNLYRRPFYSSSSTNYQKATSLGFKANQMWFMGDGSPDTFPNINNEQRPNWINYTYLVMTNMVSSDIENVTIAGLS
jgi:hypothetical protein